MDISWIRIPVTRRQAVFLRSWQPNRLPRVTRSRLHCLCSAMPGYRDPYLRPDAFVLVGTHEENGVLSIFQDGPIAPAMP